MQLGSVKWWAHGFPPFSVEADSPQDTSKQAQTEPGIRFQWAASPEKEIMVISQILVV